MKKDKITIKIGWKLLVEETEAVKDKGILAFKTDKGKTIYIRICSYEDIVSKGEIFEVVETDELRELGIAISETINERLYPWQKAESIEETEEKQGINIEESGEEGLTENDKEITKNVSVHIHGSPMPNSQNPKQDDLTEGEISKGIKDLLAKRLNEANPNLNVKSEEINAGNFESYSRILNAERKWQKTSMQKNKKEALEQAGSEAGSSASGQTPLNKFQTTSYYPFQGEIPISERTWDSYREMINDLKHEERKGNETAKKYLARLMGTTMRQIIKKKAELEFEGGLTGSKRPIIKGKDSETTEQFEGEKSKWKEKR